MGLSCTSADLPEDWYVTYDRLAEMTRFDDR
jgi:hypothetical protein